MTDAILYLVKKKKRRENDGDELLIFLNAAQKLVFILNIIYKLIIWYLLIEMFSKNFLWEGGRGVKEKNLVIIKLFRAPQFTSLSKSQEKLLLPLQLVEANVSARDFDPDFVILELEKS